MSSDYIDWLGQSGKVYRYFFVDMSKPIDAVAANYCFAQQLSNGNFLPAYFGETDNAKERLTPTHHQWDAAIRIGAIYVFGHPTPGGLLVRSAEEQDLIARWLPVLNTQHRKAE